MKEDLKRSGIRQDGLEKRFDAFCKQVIRNAIYDVLRKDNKGRVLLRGESQRSQDLRYVYSFTDPMGRRKYIYATDLLELRRKEEKLKRDRLDGLDIYLAGKATINSVFDQYISTRDDLRKTTKSGYTKFLSDNKHESEEQIQKIVQECK